MSLWPRTQGGEPSPPPFPSRTADNEAAPAHSIRGWTDTACVTGVICDWERPSDVLNRREPVWVQDVRVTPLGTDRPPLALQADRQFDPFEFDLVLVAALPDVVARRSAARRIHKVRYRVGIHAGDFEIEGVIHLFPGHDPEYAHHRIAGLFMPVTEPLVRRFGRVISNPGTDVALLNRHVIGSIRQIDWAPRRLA